MCCVPRALMWWPSSTETPHLYTFLQTHKPSRNMCMCTRAHTHTHTHTHTHWRWYTFAMSLFHYYIPNYNYILKLGAGVSQSVQCLGYRLDDKGLATSPVSNILQLNYTIVSQPFPHVATLKYSSVTHSMLSCIYYIVCA